MTASGAGDRRPALWTARHPAPGGAAVYVCTAGPEFPDGSVVELPGPPVRSERWQFEAHVAAPGTVPHRVVTAPAAAPGAPHLWCVLLSAGPDEIDLVGFSTSSFPDGRIVPVSAFAELRIAWSNQVAAVRWSPSTGVVGQLYVAPEHRRKRLAAKLLLMAGGVRVALDWAPLRSDGRLTDLGDAWLRSTPDAWQGRLVERSAHLPPMTPAAEAAGVPRRNLQPDA